MSSETDLTVAAEALAEYLTPAIAAHAAAAVVAALAAQARDYTDQGSYEGRIAAHLAFFGHPVVALAVADWLDGVADGMTSRELKHTGRALAVARAYLGEPA